jgi:hypothetical protein
MRGSDTCKSRDRFFLRGIQKHRYTLVSDWDPPQQLVGYNPPHRFIAIYDTLRWILGEHHDVLDPLNDISMVDMLIATPDMESTGREAMSPFKTVDEMLGTFKGTRIPPR